VRDPGRELEQKLDPPIVPVAFAVDLDVARVLDVAMRRVFPRDVPGDVGVVRHEQAHGFQRGDDVVESRVRHSDAVVRARATPELVENL
jgi:hypothetical protein